MDDIETKVMALRGAARSALALGEEETVVVFALVRDAGRMGVPNVEVSLIVEQLRSEGLIKIPKAE